MSSSDKNELTSPQNVELNPSYQQNYINNEKESQCNKEVKHEFENFSSNINEECVKKTEKVAENHLSMKHIGKTDLLQLTDELDDQKIREKLTNVSEHELIEILKEIESVNFYLSKENEIYEFILNDDEILQTFLGKIKQADKDISTPESFELTYSAKCYFAKKKLEYVETALKQKNDEYDLELQNLNFELESLNKSLKDLKESKEKFDKDIRIDGRHPVTNKIILQKVAKYFDDNIRTKMDLTNRYKIQIQSNIMEQNKILSQIKAQEKRLAFLDMTEFQEAQFEYKKSCRDLAMCKEQVGKYKAKFSFLLQRITKLKKDLEQEESDVEQMKNAVIKLEHLKEVMLSEKARNYEKVLELKAAMRKIKLDPRRHNLPEVIDFAAAKRENATLMKNVDKWKKKVECIQQEKLLHLNALTKKKRV